MKPCIYFYQVLDKCLLGRTKPWHKSQALRTLSVVSSRLLKIQEPTNRQRMQLCQTMSIQIGCHRAVIGQTVQWEERAETSGLSRETSQLVELSPLSLLLLSENRLFRTLGEPCNRLPGCLFPSPRRSMSNLPSLPLLSAQWFSFCIGITWRAC